ncbi:MAG: hypothetical protein L6Q99_15170 [Planctomycetes bacterium]|nr:hypothetical protein [Planctomycetota bacterium]
MRSIRSLIVILALAVLVAFLWRTFAGGGGGGSSAEAPNLGSATGAEEEVVDVPAASARTAKAVEASAQRVRPPELDALSLEERLAAIARTEGEVMQKGPTPELTQRLEDLLAPLFEHPGTLHDVLDNLVARKWKPAGEEAKRIDVVEYGGCRALYWAVVTFHSEQSPYFAEATGRELFLAILSNVPNLQEPVLSTLLEQLIRAEVDGKPLVARYIFEVLELRAFFKEHKTLFSEVLARLGETMTPEERDRFFGTYLSDLTDPVLIGAAIKFLLQGTNPAAALSLAESLFDDPNTPVDVRLAIAQAVVDGSADAYAATQFLAERIEQTRNSPGLWMSLANKPDAYPAIDAEYRNLLANDANPRAREKLVSAMIGASPEDLDRIAKLAYEDPDPKVRGQALMTATASAGWKPTPDAMKDLRSSYATGADPMRTVAAAGNIASKAQQVGATDVRDDAIDFLLDALDDPMASPQAKQSALDALKHHLSDAEWQSLQGKVKK